MSDGRTTDERTLTEKLLAMAEQDVSPNERDNARAILASKGMWPPPPRPPAPPGVMGDDDAWQPRPMASNEAWTFSMGDHSSATFFVNGKPVGTVRGVFDGNVLMHTATPIVATSTGTSNTIHGNRMFYGSPLRRR